MYYVIKILFGLIVLLSGIIIFLFCGENGSNKHCAEAYKCPLSVRCTAKSSSETSCFKAKKRRSTRF